MKISIITASFNQGIFIEKTIQSVLGQKYSNFEHIIVDNCSTDGTSEVLERYPHLKVICEKDQGQSEALNKGFKAATGDIIGWLNADDMYLPGCFKAVLEALAQNPKYDLVYGDCRFVDVNGKLIRVLKELDFDMFMLKYLHVLYIPTTTVFIRRKIFDEGNFLDINYHYAMDYEFFLRLAQRGYRFWHIPQLMADFRWHQNSKSSTQAVCQKEEKEKALLAHDPLLQTLQNPLRSWMRNSFLLVARGKRTILKIFHGAYWN